MLSTHYSTTAALSYETHARILYTTKLSNIDYNGDYIVFCIFSIA